MSLRTRTVRVDHDLDAFAIGSRSGLLWHDGDLVLAGVGEAVRLPIERPDGAAAAQAALAALAGDDDVQRPGTGPVAFASLPFDRTAAGELLVPRLVVGHDREGRRWLSITGVGDAASSEAEMAAALAEVAAVGERAVPEGAEPTSLTLQSPLPPEYWRDEVVAPVRDRIRDGELDKTVLARELRLTTNAPIDPAQVLARLRQRYRTALLFAVDGFVGASPEMLVARSGDVVRAHPLAGTAPRGADPAADAREAAELLASTKNRWEHRITIDWLLDTLLPFCSYVDAEPEPTIVTLTNVHHLGTRVEGRLSSPAASVLELVAALHPTPAVGGRPQADALALIEAFEQADRGRYAGPVGWVDGAGNGSFAVGLRSAELNEPTADRDEWVSRFFAGVGVVGDSDPAAELAETRAKFETMLGALVKP
ncbi:MAG: isochorismate synthase [Acidimicrobiales bacterium]